MSYKFNPFTGNLDTVLDKASEIRNTPAGNITSTDVQAALNELDGFISALPSPIYYAGTWSAATNTPTLANTDTGVEGALYRVNAAGTVNFGAGNISFDIGDSVVNNGTVWEKWDHSDQVISVNSQTGAVVLVTDDIAEDGSPTNLWFTDARAQTAITGGASSITTANLTANRALASNASGKVAVSATTDTELGYVSGVTSAIQTQLNGKEPTITGAATTITSANLTANRAVASDASGKVVVSATTDTELGYVSGVTSAIQTQLNGKEPTITGAATTITSSNLTASRALQSNASGKVEVSTVTSTELGYVSGVTSGLQSQLNDKQQLLQTLAVSSDVTLTANRVHLVDTTAARALTLPAAAANLTLIVKDATGGAEAFNITITPASGTIDGAALLVISSNYGSVHLVSDSTNWYVL